MWTRTSDRWNSTVGSWDKLNLKHIYPSDNKYGIPIIKAPPVEKLFSPPDCLIPYNIRVRSSLGYTDAAIHFFLDDYRFEYVWSNPKQSLQRVKQAWLALSPDFSLYVDYPLAAQIWNTYRNRWCGAYWQEHGLEIIPTISWSDVRSYDFCFDGVEDNSPVAISTQGMNWDEETTKRFKHGMSAMIERINPRFLICYGKLAENIQNEYTNTEIKCYPTYWQSLREARKKGKAEDFYAGAYKEENMETRVETNDYTRETPQDVGTA